MDDVMAEIYDCHVVIEDYFKPPLPKAVLGQSNNFSISNITMRRKSIRLQDKNLSGMNEVQPKKMKKKPIKMDSVETVNDLVQPENQLGKPENHLEQPENKLEQPQNELEQSENQFEQPEKQSEQPEKQSEQPENQLDQPENTREPAGSQPQNLFDQTGSQLDQPENQLHQMEQPENQLPDLSDNDIMNLLNDVASFIDDGVWDPTNILNSDETNGNGNLQSNYDQMSQPTSSVATVTCDQESMRSASQTDTDHQRLESTQCDNRMSISTQTQRSNQRSVSTQTDTDQLRSESTQTYFDNQTSISTQTSVADDRKTSTELVEPKPEEKAAIPLVKNQLEAVWTKATATDTNATTAQPIIKSKENAKRKLLKRKAAEDRAEHKPCQIFIKNYDLKNGSVNRDVFDFKIPKHSKSRDQNSVGSSVKSVSTVKTPAKTAMVLPVPSQTNSRAGFSKHLTSKSNFDSMKTEVLNLLQKPCVRSLNYEDCSSYCRHNHVLPTAAVVAEAIKRWSNEMIQFFNVTYVQRYKKCHRLYFEVICNAFVQSRSPESLLATVKDCERLDGNFQVILLALIQCGYTIDDALFEICTHAHRSRKGVNEILKIMLVWKLSHFQRTIAFLLTEIDSHCFEPSIGNEVLKQVAEMEVPDKTLLEFCFGIVKKYHNVLNTSCMHKLLLKCKNT